MFSVFPDFFTRSRYARPLALLTDLALAAFALWLLVRLVWALWGANPHLAATAPAPPAPANVSAEPATPLASWHLFGNALPALDPRRLARDAPETGLKLVLHGVYASQDPRAGRAIIGDDQGQERSYRSGDELPGGATLDEIYPDRVTLRRGTGLEALMLPRGGGQAPAPRAAANLPGGAHPGAPAPFINPLIVPPAVPDAARAGSALKRDPNELAREIQVLPVLENGKFAGVRLSGGKEAALLAKLGLRPDDVITEVNGIKLDSPARGSEIATSLQNAERARVTVRRDGRPVTLDVSAR